MKGLEGLSLPRPAVCDVLAGEHRLRPLGDPEEEGVFLEVALLPAEAVGEAQVQKLAAQAGLLLRFPRRAGRGRFAPVGLAGDRVSPAASPAT